MTRVENLKAFASLGVESFDSTSPLRQAFKDSKDNYYCLDEKSKKFRTFTAIRIPQVDGNRKMRMLIRSGELSQDVAKDLNGPH